MRAPDSEWISPASRFALRSFTNSLNVLRSSIESIGTMSESSLCKFGCQPAGSRDWGAAGSIALAYNVLGSADVLLACRQESGDITI